MSPLRTRPHVLWVLGFVAVACGPFGGDDPLTATAARLGDIRSGTMSLRIQARTAAGDATGFTIEGPFALPESDTLPEAELTYTRVGSQAEPLVFISTGEAAYIQVEGRAYALPRGQVSQLRGDAEPGNEGPFGALDIGAWVSDVRVSDGGKVDGVSTDVVTGNLDVVAAANDLFAMARAFAGADVPSLEGEETERVRRAVKRATLEVVTGKEDRFLRRLRVSVDLGASGPQALAESLEGLLGVEFDMVLEIQGPNEQIDVRAPVDPLPYESLLA